MNMLIDEICRDCRELPEEAVREVLDFVEFLKQRQVRGEPREHSEALPAREAFRLLEEQGLIGCIEGEEDLSVNYKQHLWSLPDDSHG
jgi:hypothetical protein